MLSTYWNSPGFSRQQYDFFSGYGTIAQSGQVAYQAVEPVGGALSQTAQRAVRGGNLRAALTDIANNSVSPLNRRLASRLGALLTNTQIEVVNDLRTEDGSIAYGAAAADGSQIWINENGGLNEETLLHEAVHAASESVLAADEATLTGAQRQAKRELERMWEAAKADPASNLSGPARTSLSEFVTEAMTNETLQSYLSNQPWAPTRSFWQSFKAAILRLIGFEPLRTMLDTTLDSMESIFASPTEAAVRPDGVLFNTPPAPPPPPAPPAPTPAQPPSPRAPGATLAGVRAGAQAPLAGSIGSQILQAVSGRGISLQARKQRLTQLASRLGDLILEGFADSLLPVVRWVESLAIPQELRERIVGAMYTAPNVRDNILAQARARYGGDQLNTELDALLQARRRNDQGATVEDVIRDAGYWVTARYALIKNARMLDSDRQATADALQNLTDAQQRLTTAQQSNATQAQLDALRDEISAFQTVYNEALATEADRAFALNGNESVDNHVGSSGRAVGLAGGMNNAQANAFMQRAEQLFGRQGLERVAQQVYRLNAFRMATDIESGRIDPANAVLFSPELAALAPEMARLQQLSATPGSTQAQIEAARNDFIDKLSRNSQYVPTTGDPEQGFEQDVLGSGFRAPNVARERRLMGRTGSLANDGITATLGGMQRSASAAGWRPFTNLIETAYNQMTDAQRQAAGIRRVPITALDRLSDNLIIVNQPDGSAVGYSIRNGEELAALRKENLETSSTLGQLIQFPTRLFSTAVTRWNLPFGPINMARDIWERSENMRARNYRTASGGAVDSSRAAADMLRTARTPGLAKEIALLYFNKVQGKPLPNSKYALLLREFEEFGGGGSKYGTFLARDRKDFVGEIKKVGSNRIVKSARFINGYVDMWNDAFDSVAPLSAYIALRNQGMSKEAAAAGALDLMNFRKTGTAMPIIRALYAFAQPTFTGGVNLAKTLKTSVGRTRALGYTAALITLHAFIASLAGEDEELGKNKFDLLDDYAKERSLPLPLPNGEFLKLPLGFGLPSVANLLALRTRDYLNNEKTGSETMTALWYDAAKQFIAPAERSKIEDDIVKALLQETSPTVLKPIVNTAINRGGLGQELVREQFLDKAQFKSEQGAPLTAEEYKWVARELRQWTGWDLAPEQAKELFNLISLGPLRVAQQVAIDNPNKERQGREVATPVVSSLIAGTTNAIIREFGKFEQAGLEAKREANSGAELTPEQQEIADLYDEWVEVEKEFRKRGAALTRAGVEKGVVEERMDLRAERSQAQADIIRRFNELDR